MWIIHSLLPVLRNPDVSGKNLRELSQSKAAAALASERPSNPESLWNINISNYQTYRHFSMFINWQTMIFQKLSGSYQEYFNFKDYHLKE